jgi:hypothetical protein
VVESGNPTNGFKADSAALREAYLPLLKTMTTRPMKSEAMGGKDKEGIADVMEVGGLLPGLFNVLFGVRTQRFLPPNDELIY